MHRDQTADLSMLERLVAPAGKDVVDIGCGGGALVRQLAGRGARVTGLEISAEQLAPALARAEAEAEAAAAAAAEAEPGAEREAGDGTTAARYLIGRAEALPLEDASVDVAVFMRTLHHVPPPKLMQALREARRVLRPGGLVYVAEPLTEGDFYALTTLVEDERDVRRAAEAAIADAAQAGLERIQTLEYDVRACFAGLAALRARIISADPARAPVFDAREAELAAAFNRLGEPGEKPGERYFVQPMRADVLRATDA